ncbi:MAG: hypothetical protein J6O18_05910 [Bacilli bacterium]|nr:hypothetical protein [Bacilli bacterium]
MPYREEFLKKLQQLREYKDSWENDQQHALLMKNVLPAREISYQLGRFMLVLNNSSELFGGKDKFNAFMEKHADILPTKRFPHIETTHDHAQVRIGEADYEKILDALDEEFKDRPEVLEDLFFKKASPDYKKINHPLSNLVDNIKKDVDTLYEDENDKAVLKEALDYANGEIVEKLGPNLVDNAVDANANLRRLKAHKEFDAFVKEKGLDSNKIKNQTSLIATISAGVDNHPENFVTFKPFRDMGLNYDEDYKNKLLQLDELLQQEGLLTEAHGGESGFKEYGLADYFRKNYALKRALTDYANLTDEQRQEKKEALTHIKVLTDEVKDVTAKYEKVFDFIEKNFDLENIALCGNVYSGRAQTVENGDIVNWKPNLPPKFDFEKTPAVIFLSGFTQLKASAQAFGAPIKDYLDHPDQAYLAGAKKFGEAEDRKYYLPPSEENTLGKRMAHMFYHSAMAYDEIPGIAMMGGRGMEFLYNTSPESKDTMGNVITSSIVMDFAKLYNRSPELYFGYDSDPDIDTMKNIFVAGDDVDKLYKLSPKYVNDDCEFDPAVKDYAAAVKAHGNTPIAEEYRRIIKAMQDCFEEEEEMSNHPEIYLKAPKDHMIHFSRGAVVAAGRQYFMDYLRENSLSITSVEDEELREEISDFIVNPLQTFNDNHYEFPEDGVEDPKDIQDGYESAWKKYGKKHAEAFAEKFEENNHKPNGYNAGKDIPTILRDNRGGWWERFRGTTSQQYRTLQKAAEASTDPESATYGDKEAMYVAAKAYRAYKLPEGRTFASLSKTAKKRVEFCDSIIAAYEQEKAARVAANNPVAPNNNIIHNDINQNDFQHQLENDLGPKENKAVKAVEDIQEAATKKEELEDSATV